MHKSFYKYVKHWLVPHETNNHRAKVLHHSSLVFFILFFAFLGLILPPVKQSHRGVLGISYSISASDLVSLTNQDRVANGLPPVLLNQQLNDAANANANYMLLKNYWAHFGPDGTTPWSFFTKAGYNYIYAGQNLARGFTTAQDAEKAWMASPEHKANILSPHYSDIGFAIKEGTLTGEDTVLIVAMFGSQSNQATQANLSTSTNFARAPTYEVANAITTNPSLSPTPSIVVNNVTVESQNVNSFVAAASSHPFIDSNMFSRNLTVFVIGALLLALLIDIFVIQRKNVVRFVSHNFDHVVFLSLLLLIIIVIVGRGSTL